MSVAKKINEYNADNILGFSFHSFAFTLTCGNRSLWNIGDLDMVAGIMVDLVDMRCVLCSCVRCVKHDHFLCNIGPTCHS